MRHTDLTWMADAGVPLHVLRTIAWPGSLTTTQRYLHPDRRTITAAGDALSVQIDRHPEPRRSRPDCGDRWSSTERHAHANADHHDRCGNNDQGTRLSRA
ncbi:hypothetical protein ACQPWY_23870 [Pseudonocardia xinjiangensis]|uniref:hypothetical protein n=1 Tax=Pseudonocardia xinjiangensis TaxID=75289 RepID=UPI003D8A360B